MNAHLRSYRSVMPDPVEVCSTSYSTAVLNALYVLCYIPTCTFNFNLVHVPPGKEAYHFSY